MDLHSIISLANLKYKFSCPLLEKSNTHQVLWVRWFLWSGELLHYPHQSTDFNDFISRTFVNVDIRNKNTHFISVVQWYITVLLYFSSLRLRYIRRATSSIITIEPVFQSNTLIMNLFVSRTFMLQIFPAFKLF